MCQMYEIWNCKLPDVGGSVQHGVRPVLVVSNNQNNAHAPTVVVVPLTSKIDKRGLPVHVLINDYRKYGLSCRSTVTVEQIITTNQTNLLYKIGTIDDAEMIDKIKKAFITQIPLMQ